MIENILDITPNRGSVENEEESGKSDTTNHLHSIQLASSKSQPATTISKTSDQSKRRSEHWGEIGTFFLPEPRPATCKW